VEKILSGGLSEMIQEAEAGLRRFREMRETDINKFYFWQAAIIVCKAMIGYSRRYPGWRKAWLKKKLIRRDEMN